MPHYCVSLLALHESLHCFPPIYRQFDGGGEQCWSWLHMGHEFRKFMPAVMSNVNTCATDVPFGTFPAHRTSVQLISVTCRVNGGETFQTTTNS